MIVQAYLLVLGGIWMLITTLVTFSLIIDLGIAGPHAWAPAAYLTIGAGCSFAMLVIGSRNAFFEMGERRRKEM